MGANESARGRKTDLCVRSSAPLFRAYTNTNIHPLFVTELAESSKNNIKRDHERVTEFLKQYTSKEGTFVPLSLLHGFISRDSLFNQNKPTHPIISPEITNRGDMFGEWENTLRRIHPDVLETVFNCSKKPDQLLKQVQNDLETYKYYYEDPKQQEMDPSVLIHDIDQDFVAKKAQFLPTNLYQPPNIPAPVHRGSCLRAFYTVRAN